MDEHRENTILLWLVLQRLPGTAAATLHKLFGRYGTGSSILGAPDADLQRFLEPPALLTFNDYRARGKRSTVFRQARKDLDWLQESGAKLLAIDDENYPRRLCEIHHAPPLLMVDGNLSVLRQDQIAIVGSRRASPAGLEHARQFAAELAECGLIVTSGLALGVDCAAHQGALSINRDSRALATIGVIATGLDQCYPSRHEKLLQEIRERGALVSEFPLGTPPIKENFPRRNRIISGLSLGVVVVEAEEKSGSLITARYALEQNREVFAVPGSINNPGSRGCHLLIRQGAHLVESVDDILRELQHPLGSLPLVFPAVEDETVSRPDIARQPRNVTSPAAQEREEIDAEESQLLACMDDCALSIDHLSRRAGKPVERVTSLLMSLEIKGWVESDVDGYRRL